MECVNCGGSLDFDNNSKYIKCKYCRTLNSNFQPLGSLDEFKVMLNDIGIDENELVNTINLFDDKDYDGLLSYTDRILRDKPTAWFPLIYRSVSLFWLGYDNFNHIDSIFTTINKSIERSKRNELAIDIKDKLVNDIIVLACKNEHYGEDLRISLDVMLKTINEGDIIQQETIDKMNEYCTEAYNKILSHFENIILRDKKEFDPPYLALKNLYKISKITKQITYGEKFYLYSKFHLTKNKNKSYANELNEYITEVTNFLNSQESQVVGKNLTFDFFGKIKIK